MDKLKDILKRLEEGETIKLNDNKEIFYISESEADEVSEIGFYLNVNCNSDEKFDQDKITDKQAIVLLAELL